MGLVIHMDVMDIVGLVIVFIVCVGYIIITIKKG